MNILNDIRSLAFNKKYIFDDPERQLVSECYKRFYVNAGALSIEQLEALKRLYIKIKDYVPSLINLKKRRKKIKIMRRRLSCVVPKGERECR